MKRILLLATILLSTLSWARNDVPSCYDTLKIPNPNPTPQKELFILVDQTTPLDKKLMIYTYKNMIDFLKNSYKITIASFSSNSNGKYTDVAYSGKLEPLLDDKQKYDIPKKKLRKYKACMNAQYRYAKKKATKALVKVLKGANKNLPYSDIIKSLHDIAKHVIQPSQSSQKVVLLVSDMLEHSSITSFYTKGRLKAIDIDKELNKIKKNNYLPNFDNADIYVIGTGMTSKGGYRSSKELKRLTDFWHKYFQLSNGNLKAIGTPMLLETILH